MLHNHFVTQNNITYSNIEYDDHDNWISRDVHQILLEGVKGQPEYMMRRDEYDYQEVLQASYLLMLVKVLDSAKG